ncbi:hypothetical protein [Raoultella planticola]|uniref:hypothetical protein n=1 Tax=Raoultella TaxID=160674 RepID=UPI00103321EB|nr:hypothetical protein [Raoultella planticola]MDU3154956.1 hypothetical protein [Hafnia alvei]HCI9483630.1 hypothetical protein [Raoultella ornithinolytica]
MDTKPPMFDIEDSEDIELEDNETDSSQLVKAKRTGKIKAKRNKAGITKDTIRKAIFIGLTVTIIGGLIVAYITKNYM